MIQTSIIQAKQNMLNIAFFLKLRVRPDPSCKKVVVVFTKNEDPGLWAVTKKTSRMSIRF